MFDVNVLSPTEAWAVGRREGSIQTPTIWHWDGTTWFEVDSPDLHAKESGLFSVDAVSVDDVWAVGEHIDLDGTPHTLIEHWDGEKWSVVPSPDPPVEGSDWDFLSGVSAAGPNDIWAVGYAINGSLYPIIEHWDGVSWTLVDVDGGKPTGELWDVTALGPDDVWVVRYPDAVQHWDGVSWTTSEITGEFPRSVAGTSTSDVWAVGEAQDSGGGIGRWNGRTWRAVKPARPVHRRDRLYAVTAIAPDDAWAVGGGQSRSVIEHWDGSHWTMTPPIRPSTRGSRWEVRLESIDGAASDDVWVVGEGVREGVSVPYFAHWNGAGWHPGQISG